MSKFVKALLLSAAATGAAALLLNQIDFEAARAEMESDFPGPTPEDLEEEDVAMLLNELASQL